MGHSRDEQREDDGKTASAIAAVRRASNVFELLIILGLENCVWGVMEYWSGATLILLIWQLPEGFIQCA
jgi:hypothetical protein